MSRKSKIDALEKVKIVVQYQKLVITVLRYLYLAAFRLFPND